MYNFTTQQYLQNFKKAPKIIVDTLLSEETSQAIKTIVGRHNIDKSSMDVAAIIGYILVGLVPIKRFIQALKEEAGLSEEVAKNVAHDIRSEILAPVAQELAKIQEEAERNWQKAYTDEPAPSAEEAGNSEQQATDNKQPGAHSGKSETLNPKSEANSKSEIQNSKQNQGESDLPAKDESVTREVFPAPEVKEDKFEEGPEGEMPEEKKDDRF